MNKKNLKPELTVRLKLERTSIRVLAADSLAKVAGGLPPPTNSQIPTTPC